MKYYVYTLAYPDGKVFYVGKGTRYRIDDHEREARTGKDITNPHKVNVIRKIWAGGGEVIKEKIYQTDDEGAAFEIERETIKLYGISNLTNILAGGEGESKGVRPEHSIYMKQNNINAKRYTGLIDPFGAEYPNIYNLKGFCEEWGVDYRSMYEVTSGRRDHYRGWRKLGRMSYVETEFVPGQPVDMYWEVRNEPTIYDLERVIRDFSDDTNIVY